MIPADQGGCMLVMRTGIPMNPSKTDHIMSRYRPIAPRPTPKTEGSDQTDSHSLSSLSVDKSAKPSGDYCRGKRRNNNNKRPPDTSTGKSSPRSNNNNVKKPRQQHGTSSGSGKSGGGAEGNVEFQPPSFNLTPIFSEQVAPVFGPGGLQRFKDSFDHSQTGVSVSLSLSAKSPPPDHGGFPLNLHSALQCSKDGLSFNIGAAAAASPSNPCPDTGFMERAAINSTSLYSAEHSNANIRTRAPFFGGYSSFSTSGFGADSEVCSPPSESKTSNIVTLSLLPDTPSYVNTRSTSSTSTLSLLRSDIRWNSPDDAKPCRATSSDLNTSLTMSSIGRGWSELEGTNLLGERFLHRPAVEGAASHGDGGMVVLDAHDLQQRHGGSSEAVMLTDERDTVLWVNSAFQRLSNERTSSRMQAIAPHIDPLGIRTRLATLTFQPPFPASKCKAVLWGFLKKFIMHEGGTTTTMTHNNIPASHPSEAHARVVIAPQPLGSTITVQTIDTVNPHAAPLTESYESVQARLNHGNDMPSVITDLRFRVRWVNASYKRFVGQPKRSSWLVAATGDNHDGDGDDGDDGDVSLVCDASQLPDDIAAFTCRVAIHWSHQGEHSAMSVPSEIVRLDDAGTSSSSYVWRFDVCDAGVKNVLQIENASPFC